MHPHFEYIEDSPTELYRSRAGMGYFIVQENPHSEFIAWPAMHDGSRLRIPDVPFAQAASLPDLLDKVHARR